MVKSITELLRDPVWSFSLGVLFTVIISIIFYLIQRSRKLLSYDIGLYTRIITKEIESEDKLKILFNNKRVKNTFLIIISIFNSGNIPIKTNDYEKELRFNFGEDSEVLEAEVLKTKPDNLNIEFNQIDNFLSIKPFLLNSKEFVTFKVLVSEFSGDINNINLDGRIVGVNMIVKKKPKYIIRSIGLVIMLQFLGVVAIMILSLKNIKYIYTITFWVTTIIVFFIFSIILILFLFILFKIISKIIK
jgi:hypothetical protein